MTQIQKIDIMIDEKLTSLDQDYKLVKCHSEQHNTTVFLPVSCTKEALKVINIVGIEHYNAALKLEHIKNINNDPKSQQLHIYYQLIQILLSILDTENPNHMHYDIVEAAMEATRPEWIKNTSIRDRVARELIESCRNLQIQIRMKAPKYFQKLYTEKSKNTYKETIKNDIPFSTESLDIIHLNYDSQEIDNAFESENDMFIWDQESIKIFSNMGKKGKATAKDITSHFKSNFKSFKEMHQNPLSLWFNTSNNEQFFYISTILVTLTKIIIEDIISPSINFALNNPAGITTNVHDPISKMLSTRSDLKDNQLLYKNQLVVGSFDYPSIIMDQLSKGVKAFKTLTAAKIIRFFIQRCYDEMIHGNSDYRILKFPGGAQEIAQCLGIKSSAEIANIKTIINALDHFKFSGENIKSRLISVGTCKSASKFSKQEGYEITVQTPLLPYRILEEGSGFIIPLLQEPTMFGHRSYYARLYILQWKITEEFVKHSRGLATDGYITITDKRFKELFHDCDLPEKILPALKATWTSENDMLIEIAPNKYTLNRDKKALRFLEAGGIHRNIQSTRGKASVTKKKKKV